ncbi:MAG: glycosyltransferase [Eubacterium sp.]|nr:glycosyltransferase [Eubacterium sp.]
MDKIAVLIPCYNEEATVEKVVRDFKAALPEAVVYVYDNNSTDNTAQLAAAAGAVVRKEPNQGKGNVIRRMFREIDAECYIMADGDDTYPAEYAPEMANYVLQENADMVIGDRLSSTYYSENKRPFHNLGNAVVKAGINTIFKSDIKDIMTGYRAFSFLFVKTFPVLSEGFTIETEMTIHAVYKNMNCKNVVIDYRDRPENSQSKLNTYSDGFKVITMIGRLFKDYRPLAFFSTAALLLIIVALAFFIPVFVNFLHTGTVEKIPTVIVSGITALAAVVSFFSGLVLDTIKQKNRQDFEIQLIRANDRLKDLRNEK